MSVTFESSGLSTRSAMKKLVDQIEFELNNCKCSSHGFHGFKLWLKESFSHKSVSSTFQWPSVLMLFTCSTAFLISSIYKNDNYLLNESIFLYFILVLNIVLVGFETKLRHQEIHTKTGLLASKIRNSLLKNESIIDEWKTGKYYPHLHLQSPCISLQWTFRDNIQVNLPTSLLVKGDVVLLCPGNIAPAHCQSIQTFESSFAHQYSEQDLTNLNDSQSQVIELKRGDYFLPNNQGQQKFPSFNNPRIRKAAMPMKFRLLETPIIPLLRFTLDKSCKRPVTSYEKERFAIMVKYVEHIIAPILLFISVLISLTHYVFLSNESHEFDFSKKNLEWILLRPAMIIIPMLPLMSPVSWILLNAFGYAKLYLAVKTEENRHKTSDCSKQFSNGMQWSPGDNLGSPDSKSKMNVCGDLDYELDGNSVQSIINENEATFCSNRKQLLSIMKRLLLNQDESLWRSANLLQVFGSITALSCVDKKGILSTPSSLADKVFFLNSTASDDEKTTEKIDEKGSQDLINLDGSRSNLVDQNETNNNQQSTNDLNNSTNEPNSKLNKKQPSLKKKANKYCTKAEVLDVTPDKRYGLQFDDPDWQRFLPNLKPLGLAILLNTCNSEVQEDYAQFINHICQESLLIETKLPVVSKRCLCEFAKQIGFTKAATNDYNYLLQIFSYRHIKPEEISKGKLAKSLNLKRLKMPFPNLSSTVIKDTYSNSYFLFSQGSGDLVLDSVSEFWDGEDLCLLSEADKKHILDFYQRSSLTANCVAFAYSPLSKSLEKNIIDDQYIEFPPDSSHLFKSQKNPKLNNNEQKTIQSHHLSTDSLVMKDGNEEKERPKSTLSNNSTDGQNLELILKQLCNQVFIGMVTMQYHACPDFVHLVEILDKACVRFVHFSKENELRSRTFSEKMGLESGWNCCISLLSDKTLTCENPNCRIMNCDGALCSSKLQTKKPLAMNMSDQSNVNFPSANLQRSQSAPSYVTVPLDELRNTEQIDEFNASSNNSATQDFNKRLSNAHESSLKESSFNVSEESISDRLNNKKPLLHDNQKQADESGSKQFLTGSPASSKFSDSINDKGTAPITFDISNRARLPKGIENIRPHLENVDNVPLLVSLFTDCTPKTTCEMIKIMQEYGEVVCVIGSTSNLSNIPIFLEADTSIGIQPLYPQVCVQIPVTESNGEIPFKEFISPIDLSRELISLPCAFSIHREDVVSLSKLICYCRNFMLNARNYIQFYVSCCLSLALAQFCTSLLFLPPLFSPGHMLWICCFVIPFLSYSLMGAELNDPKVMNLAMGKNLNLIMSKSSILYFLLCYLLKFSISAIIVVFNFAMLIANYNELPESSLHSKRYFFMIDIKEEILNNFDTWSFYLFFCQTFSVFFFVLYFIIISLGFVYRQSLLWQRNPLNNKPWFVTSIFILLMHSLFCVVIIQIFRPSNVSINYYLSSIPTSISIVALVWPLPLISLNSLVKRRELKIYGRQQRRARLEFNTKLGMNSPW